MAKSKKPEKKQGKAEKRETRSLAQEFFENRPVYLTEAYAAFIRWTILTKAERKARKEPATQTEFAKNWKVNMDTLTDWKKREDFKESRAVAFREKLAEEVPEVMADLRKRIKKYGMAQDIELYLAYAEQWDRKSILEIKTPLEFGIGDIRALVNKLPAEERKEYYQTLAKLIAKAKELEGDGITGSADNKKPDKKG